MGPNIGQPQFRVSNALSFYRATELCSRPVCSPCIVRGPSVDLKPSARNSPAITRSNRKSRRENSLKSVGLNAPVRKRRTRFEHSTPQDGLRREFPAGEAAGSLPLRFDAFRERHTWRTCEDSRRPPSRETLFWTPLLFFEPSDALAIE